MNVKRIVSNARKKILRFDPCDLISKNSDHIQTQHKLNHGSLRKKNEQQNIFELDRWTEKDGKICRMIWTKGSINDKYFCYRSFHAIFTSDADKGSKEWNLSRKHFLVFSLLMLTFHFNFVFVCVCVSIHSCFVCAFSHILLTVHIALNTEPINGLRKKNIKKRFIFIFSLVFFPFRAYHQPSTEMYDCCTSIDCYVYDYDQGLTMVLYSVSTKMKKNEKKNPMRWIQYIFTWFGCPLFWFFSWQNVFFSLSVSLSLCPTESFRCRTEQVCAWIEDKS